MLLFRVLKICIDLRASADLVVEFAPDESKPYRNRRFRKINEGARTESCRMAPKANESRPYQYGLCRMESSRKVRFGLFGNFRIEVDGQPIELPNFAFFSYLRLLVLSGEPYLASSVTCSHPGDAKAVRETASNGNNPPQPGKGGRYDFTAKTGLSLKYREGFGLELQGDEFESDVAEFEEVWLRRTKLPDTDLENALDLYGKGVNLKTWPREKVLSECQQWIEARVQIVEQHREEIEAELERRRKAAASEPIVPGQGHGGELNKETPFPNEISGLDGRPNESTEVPQASTSLGQGLGVVSVPKIEPSSEGRRTISALGVLAVAVLLGFVFSVGFILGRLTAPAPVASVADKNNRPDAGLEKDASNRQDSSSKSTPGFDGTDPGNQGDNKPVGLRELLRPSLSSRYVKAFDDEVLVAKRIFPGYIGHEYLGVGVTLVAVLKLDGQFQAFHCDVGIRDDQASLIREKKLLKFEGDGRLLEQVELRPGIVKVVDFSVKGVGTLTITFVSPAVIFNGSCSR